MQGYEAIPRLIEATGVSAVFGMLGGTNVAWMAQGMRTGAFRAVKTRHEETSVSAATGYSRATGDVGFCTVIRGPGFANSINALRAAAQDHVPVVLIVSESPAKIRTTQNIAQREISELIGAGFHHAGTGKEIEDAFWDAVDAARRNGTPQVLSVADSSLDDEVVLVGERGGPARRDAPDPDSIAAAVDVLERSERPLILAGQGALLSDCRAELETLAELVGARLATTLNANWFFSGHPYDLGVCGDSSPPMVLEQFMEVDAVLAVGATLNSWTTSEGLLLGKATIIQCEVDIDQPFKASSPELGLLGDARATASALIDEWEKRSNAPRRLDESELPTIEELQESLMKPDLGHDPARGLDLRRVYRFLNEKLPTDRIIVNDSSINITTRATLLEARDGKSWLVSRGYGSIGLGLGAAIGAATAEPDRNVVLFCGDGGFAMSSHDVDALRINGIDNVSIVIMNDEQYRAELSHLNVRDLPTEIVRQSLPDVPKLASAYGGVGIVVETEEELAELDLDRRGIVLADVRIDPELNPKQIY